MDHQTPHLHSVIDSTPSRSRNPITFLPEKYKPRDSTDLFGSDSDRILGMLGIWLATPRRPTRSWLQQRSLQLRSGPILKVGAETDRTNFIEMLDLHPIHPAGGMCPERFERESNIPGEDLGNGEYRASAQGLTKSWRRRRTSAHVQAGIDSC